jgi:hypothetical protein
VPALFFLFAAQPLGRRLQPAADALGLLRLLAFGLVRIDFGLRARIELAADELDLRDFGRVALAEPNPQQTRVTTRTLGEPGRERLEQLGHDLPILQVVHHQAAGM